MFPRTHTSPLLIVYSPVPYIFKLTSAKHNEVMNVLYQLSIAQAGINIAWRNINNLKHEDDNTLMAESKEGLKSLLMKVKESEKAGLKLSIQKTKIIASSPIQFSSIQSLSCVRLFVTSWTVACQTSLFITNSQSLLKLISIELVRPSNRLVPCHPLLSSLSDPITSWQIDGETVETVQTIIFGSQITEDGDCSH